MSTLQLMTMAEAAAAIPLLATDAANVQSRIHLIACSTLEHVKVHGDTRGATDLCNALPNGQRVKALVHWYRVYSGGKLIFKLVDGKWAANLSKTRAKDGSDFDVDAACETTFADLTTERDPVSVSVESFIRNIVRMANNADNFEGTDVPKVAPEAREVAAKVVAFLTDSGIRKVA